MKESKFFNWISKHIDWIVVITIGVIFFAPSFISQSYCEWWKGCPIFRNINFSNTGQIGDTIGGITAPFIGVLSIILLYITFKAQSKFNSSQQFSNEIEAMWKMANDIGENAQNFNFPLEGVSISLENIEELKKMKLKKDDFLNLYNKISFITNLCFLAYEFNEVSSLSKETKHTFYLTFWLHSQNAAKFWGLCIDRKIELIDINYNLIDLKWEEINSYIDRLQKYTKLYKS
jgi:hypothetical protein